MEHARRVPLERGLALPLLALYFASATSAVPIDGALDPEYGVALSTQVTNTDAFDASEMSAPL